MPMEKQVRIIKKLIEDTPIGILDWSTGIDDDSYILSLTKGAILIRKTKLNNVPIIEIVILNEDGNIVETFNDEDIKEKTGENYFGELVELHEAAGRIAMGTERTLDDLIRELDSKMPF